MLYISAEAEVAFEMLPEPYKKRVRRRIAMMIAGHFQDTRSLGAGLLELRIHAGPGVRVYYCWHQGSIVIIYMGTKHHQDADIMRAKKLLQKLKEHNNGA